MQLKLYIVDGVKVYAESYDAAKRIVRGTSCS